MALQDLVKYMVALGDCIITALSLIMRRVPTGETPTFLSPTFLQQALSVAEIDTILEIGSIFLHTNNCEKRHIRREYINKYKILTATPSVNNEGRRKNAPARESNPGPLIPVVYASFHYSAVSSYTL